MVYLHQPGEARGERMFLPPWELHASHAGELGHTHSPYGGPPGISVIVQPHNIDLFREPPYIRAGA